MGSSSQPHGSWEPEDAGRVWPSEAIDPPGTPNSASIPQRRQENLDVALRNTVGTETVHVIEGDLVAGASSRSGLYSLGSELRSELAVVKLVYSNLRKKDVKSFVSTFCSKYQRLCTALGVAESSEGLRVVYEDVEIVAIGGIPLAFRLGEEFVPTLVAVKTAGVGSTHYAVVDEGAVKHILRGADVMAPGIVEVSGFAVGDVVSVWAPGKVSPIAVGRALMSSEEVLRVRRGRAVENLHYAGDRIWEASLEVIKRFSGG